MYICIYVPIIYIYIDIDIYHTESSSTSIRFFSKSSKLGLQDLQPLLDEATDLTQELRGRPIVVSPGTCGKIYGENLW